MFKFNWNQYLPLLLEGRKSERNPACQRALKNKEREE